MKAAICYEFGKPLKIDEIELDPPQEGEVKVKLSACAICHSDIHAMEGAWGGSLPAVYGHEGAGQVEAVGPNVTRIKPGDTVVVSLIRSCGHCYYCTKGLPHMCESPFELANQSRLHTKDGRRINQGIYVGGFAECVVVHESQVVKIPKEIPLDSASLLPCGVITGLGAVVNTAKVTLGSSVVVIGTGGVGMNSVQGARLAGAQPIIAIDIEDTKLEAAKEFGATHTVNPTREDAVNAVRSLTRGRGADYVFVAVGSEKAIEQGIELLRKVGTLIIVGMPAVGRKMQIEVAGFADNSLCILASKMGSARLATDVPMLVGLYMQGRLKLDELITARYPLEEINEAIAAVNRGEALRNVIVY